MTFRPRTVLTVLAIVLAVAGLLELIWVARQVITWIFVAFFLALALNPLVEWIQRHGVPRRGFAAGIAFLAALGVIAALGGLFVPILVGEIREFADAVPGYVRDLTAGRGRLGFLEREYEIVERVQEAVDEAGAARLLGFSGAAVAVTKGVITAVVATITIAVMTFFMLLEGPTWLERGLSLLPEESGERWRAVGHQIYRTVGGFVTGAVTIALVAGTSTAVVLSILGVPYAIALGLVVALLDLVPLAGATIAGILITTVGFLDSVAVGLVVLVFFLVYQQVENHFLYPLVYSRTVQLSPLAILIAVLIGASLAGILGALAAIPVAGTVQVLLREWLSRRRRPIIARADEPPPGNIPAPG